jgi:hypothetical protein
LALGWYNLHLLRKFSAKIPNKVARQPFDILKGEDLTSRSNQENLFSVWMIERSKLGLITKFTGQTCFASK